MKSPPRSVILTDFKNREYQFAFPKSWKRCGIKEEENGKTPTAKRYASQANAKNP